MALYKGFSLQNYNTNGSFSVTDLELVKRDILAHIWTRKGERVMMPDFGTTLMDTVFEPLDNTTVITVREELRAVIEQDPRVRLLQLDVQPLYSSNSIVAIINLMFIELNIVDNINLNIVFEDL